MAARLYTVLNSMANTIKTHTHASSSDIRLKEDVVSLDEKYDDLFKQLKPIRYKFKSDDKIHFGFVAQDIIEAMNNVNLNENDYDFIRKEDEDENGYYSLVYPEFIALNTHIIQKQQIEIDNLKGRIKELEIKLAE